MFPEIIGKVSVTPEYKVINYNIEKKPTNCHKEIIHAMYIYEMNKECLVIGSHNSH